MKTISRYGLALVCMMICMTVWVTPQLFAEGFVPTWKVGEKWTLEATYRDLKEPGEVWLPPIQWTFMVRAVKNHNGVDCYVVHVFPRKGEFKMQAVLWLAVDDLRPVRVIDIFPTNEGAKFSDREIDPQSSEPLMAIDTMVPYDLPVFPLVKADNAVQGADGFDAYRSQPAEKKYSKISKVGGLSFKRTIGQTNKAPEKQYADTFAAYRNGGETFQVEIAEERSNANITQLWQQGSPWAVSSSNRDRKVRLLTKPPVAPQENGGEF